MKEEDGDWNFDFDSQDAEDEEEAFSMAEAKSEFRHVGASDRFSDIGERDSVILSSDIYSPQDDEDAIGGGRAESSSFLGSPIVPEVELNPRITVQPSSHHAAFLDLQQWAFSVKLVCGLHLVLALGWIFQDDFFWMSLFSIFSALGFAGAHYFKPWLILGWLFYLVADMVSMIIFLFISLLIGGIVPDGVVFSVLWLAGQLFIFYVSYQFYKKLPKEDFKQTFHQFISVAVDKIDQISGENRV